MPVPQVCTRPSFPIDVAGDGEIGQPMEWYPTGSSGAQSDGRHEKGGCPGQLGLEALNLFRAGKDYRTAGWGHVGREAGLYITRFMRNGVM